VAPPPLADPVAAVPGDVGRRPGEEAQLLLGGVPGAASRASMVAGARLMGPPSRRRVSLGVLPLDPTPRPGSGLIVQTVHATFPAVVPQCYRPARRTPMPPGLGGLGRMLMMTGGVLFLLGLA